MAVGLRTLVPAVVVGLVLAAAPPAHAQSLDPTVALRQANEAANAGDWTRVSTIVLPLLSLQLERADLAEAHRLAGIAAALGQPSNSDAAEHHFLLYLKLDPDAHLDPALYPPEVVNQFNDVRAKHASELKRLRPKKRYAFLALAPPFAQFQNGDRIKGYIIGGLLGASLATHISTYFVLRSWCTRVSRDGNESVTCDDPKNRVDSATTLRGINMAAGLVAIATYVYGVYDGVSGYRRETRERSLLPYASSTNTGAVVGVRLNF